MLLLPANFDHTPGPMLLEGTERIDEILARYLRDRGYAVESPSLSSVIALWDASTEAAGGLETEDLELDEARYEAVRSDVARRTLAVHPADVVVVPTLMIRKGPVYTGRLVWDGTSREIPLETEEANIPIASISGEAPGTSLRLTLYDEHASRFFERYVGIEPVNALSLRRTRGRWAVRNDLFQDEKILEWAVKTAFEPWLTAPVASSE